MFKDYESIPDINVSVGDNFEVKLDTLAGTGYTWFLPSCPNCVNLLKIEYVPETTRIGGPVKEIFHFKAITPCQCYLEFILERYWEKKPIDKKIFALIIK